MKKKIEEIVKKNIENVFAELVKEFSLVSGDIEPMQECEVKNIEDKLKFIGECFVKNNAL